MSEIDIKRVEPTEEACTELAAFLVPFHMKHAEFPLNAEKAMEAIYITVRDDTVYAAFKGGKIVGSIALFLEDVWYSSVTVMWNRWLCVDDGNDGVVLRRLLDAAKEDANSLGIPFVVERSASKLN